MVGAYGSLLERVLNDLLDSGTGSLIFLLKPIDQLEDIAIPTTLNTSLNSLLSKSDTKSCLHNT